MPRKLDSGSTSQGLAIASLVAAISCAAAGEARASLPRTEADAALSTRVAALVACINHGTPTLARELAPERKIAQWRN